MSAGFGCVNGLFVRSVGFDFGALKRAQIANFFDVFGFFDGIVGDFDFIDGADFLDFALFVLFLVVFVECSAADDCVSGSVRLDFILLRFDDARSESSDFVFAQRRFGRSFFPCAAVFELMSFFAIRRRRGRALKRAFGCFRSGLGFGARAGKKPAWESGGTTRRVRVL